MKPGIYEDLTDDDYHSSEGYSSTQIKRALRTGSPRKALAPTEDKPHYRLGRLVHMAVLEPGRWADLIEKQVPDGDWRKKHHDAAKAVVRECKYEECPVDLFLSDPIQRYRDVITEVVGYKPDTSWGYAEDAQALAEFYMEVGTDFDPVDDDTIDEVKAMRDAVRSHPAVEDAWLDDSKREHSIYWTEETRYGEVLCKARPDMLIGTRMPDLKTTSHGADARSFAKSAHNLGYHTSASFYARGVSQAGLGPVEKATFIVVEKSPPYEVAVYDLPSEALLQGQQNWQAGLDLLAAHEMNPSAYPGYSESVQTLELPGWSASNDEAKVQAAEQRATEIASHAPF